MRAIDAHVHVFSSVRGRNSGGPVRGTGFGWVVQGGEIRPFLPPLAEETAFRVDNLSALMAQNSVDKAVLFQNPTIGEVNEEIAQALFSEPGRFAGVVQIDPLAPDAVETLRRYARIPGFRALKLEMSCDWGWCGIHPSLTYDALELRALIATAGELGLAVVLDTGAWRHPGQDATALERLLTDFPDASFLIEHLGYPMPGQLETRDGEAAWMRLIGFAARPRVFLGLSAVGTLLQEEYPCPRAQELLRRAVEVVGADKVLWGSDAPTTLLGFTYAQLLDVVRRHCPFLVDAQRARILYKNAERFYFAEEGRT